MTRWRQRKRELARTGLVVLVLLSAGCTRVVDAPRAAPARDVGPIAAAQVSNLLSPKVASVEGNQFDKVEPDRCAPVAREVAAPFLTGHHPAATDGGHWQTEDGAVVVEEIVAVYPSDFAPETALAEARSSIESCRDAPLLVTTVQGRDYGFRVVPGAGSSPAGAVLWSLRGADWSCDNALVAAHNAAIEITTCGATGGLDTVPLAEDALKRIEALANAKV